MPGDGYFQSCTWSVLTPPPAGRFSYKKARTQVQPLQSARYSLMMVVALTSAHGASAHGTRLTGAAGRDKKRTEGTRPGKQTVTPHFALSGNPMKNPQTTGPGYIPSAQVMYPVRSHSGAPQGDPPIKSKDAGTTPIGRPSEPCMVSCPYAQACSPPEWAGTRLRFQTNFTPC